MTSLTAKTGLTKMRKFWRSVSVLLLVALVFFQIKPALGSLCPLVIVFLLLVPNFVSDWLWKLADQLVRWAKQLFRRALKLGMMNSEAWDAGIGHRRFLLKMGGLGVALLILFPFSMRTGVATPISFFGITKIEPLHLWEWAVCAWSGVFLFIFVIRETFEFIRLGKVAGETVFGFALVLPLALLLIVAVLTYLMLGPSLSAERRLVAELFFCVVVCAQDALFIYLYRRLHDQLKEASPAEYNHLRRVDLEHRKEDSQTRTTNFVEFLVLIDLPGVAAFAALTAYTILVPTAFEYDGCHHIKDAFASGAAALNLILINVAFISLAIWQIYDDTAKLVDRQMSKQ